MGSSWVIELGPLVRAILHARLRVGRSVGQDSIRFRASKEKAITPPFLRDDPSSSLSLSLSAGESVLRGSSHALAIQILRGCNMTTNPDSINVASQMAG